MSREIDEAQLRTLFEQGVSQREIARRLGITRSTLQDHLKRLAPVKVHRGTSTPVQRPVQSVDTGAVQTLTTDVERIDAPLQALAEVVSY
jgi:transposase